MKQIESADKQDKVSIKEIFLWLTLHKHLQGFQTHLLVC